MSAHDTTTPALDPLEVHTDTDIDPDPFVERLFEAALGAMDVFSIYVGDKLGLYDRIAQHDGIAGPALADGADIAQRYADEWLEQQVTTGILTVDDPSLPADRRTYRLPSAHAEVLTDRDSLAFLTPFVRLLVAAGTRLPDLLDAYRSGGGVPWAAFGPDMRTGQAEMNRPWFLSEIGSSWFPAVDDLHARLQRPARVADVGCGEGWSSIAIARAYPEVVVDGYDVDAPSVEAARRHAAESGVADRVAFHLEDPAAVDDDRRYDVVTAFECIHDMPDPVGVLTAVRRFAAPDGIVVVMDEAVGERFGDRTDEIERLMYGFSLFVCLPDGMSHQPSAATGTVIRPSTVERYARDAGFDGAEVLPIENDLWRFYRLTLPGA